MELKNNSPVRGLSLDQITSQIQSGIYSLLYNGTVESDDHYYTASNEPATDAIFTTLACPPDFRSGCARRDISTALNKLISNSLRYSSSEYATNFLRTLVPTLLTSISNLPQF